MASDDLHSDMARHPLDEHAADRLLLGALDPEDAPPGYAGVAALLRAARGPATADEVARRAAVVSAMAAAGIGAGASAVPTPKGNRMLGKLVSLKALGIALPAMALTATGAAAATGSLPAPAQSAIHGALAHVGLSVPSGNDSSTQAKGHDATGRAKYGLCKAYAASNGHASTNSVAFANLQKAAAAAGQRVADFCKSVTPGNSSTNAGTGSGDSTGPNAGDSGSGTPSTPAGPPTSTPATSTPVSTPAGPPTSTPATSTPVPTPAGPPTSTPAGKP